mmetsp:Transcript_11223/g.12868  ORF Transcript_11223/g.12868 Transcript_11223/m.12868 type:complete len:429 (+) Transcript_11223:102-1388(+)
MVALMDSEKVIVAIFNTGEIVHELTEHVCRSLSDQDANAFRIQCERLAQEGDLNELVQQVFSRLSTSFAGGDETVKIFSVLFSLMGHLSPEIISYLIAQVCETISTSSDNADTRLAVMQDVYSILGTSCGDPRVKFQTFVSCLQYAIQTGQQEKLIAGLTVEDTKKFCKKLGANVSDERNLTLLICDAIEAKSVEDVQTSSSLQDFLVSYLESFHAEGPEVLSTVSEYAAKAALGAIKQPFRVSAEKDKKGTFAGRVGGVTAVYQLQPVQYLKNSSSSLHKGAFSLLEVFCEGSLQKFSDFVKENAGIFESLKLDKDSCHENMRFLALAHHASNNDNASYATVASVLEVDVSEVEKWIVKGIEKQLLDAKLDQLNETIVINRGSQSLFTENQWMELDAKLKSWTTSVHSVLATVKQAKLEQAKLAKNR